MKKIFSVCLLTILLSTFLFAQDASPLEIIKGTEPQPLLAQAIRLEDALSFLGSSLSNEDAKRLRALQDKPRTEQTSALIQNILDPYCLAMVSINPEARVKVARGPAKAKLVQGGWTSFLIKVYNAAGVTAHCGSSSRGERT